MLKVKNNRAPKIVNDLSDYEKTFQRLHNIRLVYPIYHSSESISYFGLQNLDAAPSEIN